MDLNFFTAEFWKAFIPKSFSVLSYGYTLKELKKDIIAGFTVAVVALPLSMALAIASGATPDKGLFTAIIAGFIISALGGSRFQIGGPTGAFVVLVFSTIQKHGYEGLVITTLLAGIILCIAALCKLGNYIKYIPYPVITGFTTGIALIIFSTQINDIFGFGIKEQPAHFFQKWSLYLQNLANINYQTLTVSLATLFLILTIKNYKPLWPSFLIGMLVSTVICYYFKIDIETIGARFGDISSSLPSPKIPDITIDKIIQLLPDAIVIAFLAGVESLLSAIVADGMTGRKHKSNAELLAQGIANIASALFGGIPATGAIARTATNIKAGAHSPVSGMLHAIFILLFMVFLAPLAKHVPLAVLGAILVVVAWNMSEMSNFRNILTAPRGDSLVLITTFVLTVVFDLTFAIKTGVILSAIVFMHRMSQAIELETFITPINKENENEIPPKKDPYLRFNLPEGIEAFKLRGPLFFGVSSRIVDMLNDISSPDTIIIGLDEVPFVDISAENSLCNLIKKCKERGINVVISGNVKQVIKTAKKAVIKTGHGSKVSFAKNFELAIEIAKQL